MTTKIFIDLRINRNNIETKQQVIMQFYILLDKVQEYKEMPLGSINKSLYRYLKGLRCNAKDRSNNRP